MTVSPAILNNHAVNLRIAPHTPGPFYVSDDLQVMKPTDDGPWLVLAHVLEQGDDSDKDGGEGRVDPDTAYANAVLFGAAPAMLAALREAYLSLECHRHTAKVTAIVAAAIAAAEGRS